MSRFRGGGSRPRPRPGGARGGARGRGRPSGPGGFFGPRETGPVGPKVVELPPTISVMDLATRLNTPPAQVIKALLQKGVSSTINNLLEYDASSSIAEALGFSVSREGEVVIDVSAAAAKHAEDSVDHFGEEANLVPRPPVVTIMGHVDHGKTSLLDALREARVAEGEAGGITQHIGAYQVEQAGRLITFIDTPGHAAFTAMRARGARVTDIAIIVVAADDGVMPQTIESIQHARAAQVPFIIAINKIDRANARPDRVRQMLADNGVLVAGWGGEVETVEVSALQKLGLDDLLEMILLVTDVTEPVADPDAPASGTIIEARVDRSRGAVSTVLVANGTLRAGDWVLVDKTGGRVRAMTDYRGNRLKEAPPSTPVEITGLDDVPSAGDRFVVMPDEASMRAVIKERKDAETEQKDKRLSLDEILAGISLGEVKELNVILKADVQGSVEAIRGALEKLGASVQGTTLRVLYDAVGAPTDTDVNLAVASKAIIVAFNVRTPANVVTFADSQGVEIRNYQIIYNLLDELETALRGLIEPTFREVVYGHAEVRAVFRSGRGEAIVGTMVRDGIIRRGANARVLRAGEVVYTTRIGSLRRFKDDVREVASGYECGLGLENVPDPRVGDIVEIFGRERV
ncbi:MAG: translation initiation factor IF-2 [Chloroflexota bacterium]|jgi:translation initiation factor IF-2|nr:translation initiation factor IF-2 [Chloroflexota bacterium]NCA12970.1 translation initiation factor IF-2 [Pseudomonadota bacterium]